MMTRLPSPVLVTRPLPQAESTARRLQAGGYSTRLAPMLTVTGLASPCPLETPPDRILLTSARALSVPGQSPVPAMLLHRPCHCVGPATAQAAQAHGFCDIRQAQGSAAALVASLPSLSGERLLWLAGTERSEGIAAALRATGAQLVLWERYRADPVAGLPPPIREALAAGALGTVLLFSRRTAGLWLQRVADAGLLDRLRHCTAACLSPAIAEIAATQRWAAVQTAQPGEADPLRSLTGC